MVVIMAAAGAVLIVLVVMLMRFGQQVGGHRVAALHGGQQLLTGELRPVGGDDRGAGVLLPQQGHSSLQLLGSELPGAAEDDGSGILHLVDVELTEVLHIDLALGGIGHSDGRAKHHVTLVGNDTLHRLHHIAELAHAAGLDEDAVGVELIHDLAQGLAEIAHQGAADAAGVHLADLHAGLLQEAAVDADLTEFVLDEDNFLALQRLIQQLFDQRGLTGSQKAGDNIDFRHRGSFFLIS